MNDENQKNEQKMQFALGQINQDLKEKSVEQMAKDKGFNYVNIQSIPINTDLLKLTSPEQMKKALILPFFRVGKNVKVAVFDNENPKTIEVLNELKERGFEVEIHLATDNGILSVIDTYEGIGVKQTAVVDSNDIDETMLKAYEEEIKNLGTAAAKLATMTADEAVNLVCVGGIKTKASDIHFQPEEKECAVRFRIDGMMQKIMTIDLKTYENILNQIKYKSKLKLNITNEPQDGRFYFKVNNQKIDVRTAIIPTEFGESTTLRLLDGRKEFLELSQLGFNGSILDKIEKLCTSTVGLILVTGPTGSGKTTTLYAMLNKMNKPEVKIITLEDPIEYHIEGVAQSQINDKRGYTFGNGLKAILRQNPNIVMIGEIRDTETAQTACQGSLTGHLVLSTLHTNDAISSITRMKNIGVEEYMLAPSLKAIVAQRLVRLLCKCKQSTTAKDYEIEFLKKNINSLEKKGAGKFEIPQSTFSEVGCDECSHTGYKGQTQIAEILTVNNRLKEMILEKASEQELKKVATDEGMITMEEDGVVKVLAGITTVSEIVRVVNQN